MTDLPTSAELRLRREKDPRPEDDGRMNAWPSNSTGEDLIIPGEVPPSIIFEVPQLRWPTEGTLTLIRDAGLREGQKLTLTAAGSPTVYRVTKVEPPGEDDPDGSWTVSVVEWQ